MEYYDLDDLDHDPEIAKALGNMVVIWARVESSLSFVLSELISFDPNATQIAYYRISTFDARAKFILALANQWSEPTDRKENIIKIIEGFRSLAETRNKWIHGIWCVNREINETSLFHLSGRDKASRTPVKAADIKNHVSAVKGKIKQLRDLLPDKPWV